MKKTLLVFILILSTVGVYAGNFNVTLTLANPRMNPTSTKYWIDVYIENTSGGTFDIQTADLAFTFNDGANGLTYNALRNINSTISANYTITPDYNNLIPNGLNVDLSYSGSTHYTLSTTSGGQRLYTVEFNVAATASPSTDFSNLKWDDVNTGLIDFSGGSNFTTNTFTPDPNSGSPMIVTPLPVELTSFMAYKGVDGKSTNLEWTTASEANNDGFTIERSTDLENWSAVGSVKSLAIEGKSSSELKYSYRDDLSEILPYSQGKVFYYRLKQTDYNGKFEYVGGNKAVRFDASDVQVASVNVYPNPFVDFVTLELLNGGYGKAFVYDQSGRMLKEVNMEGSAKLYLSEYQPGVYVVKVMDLNGKEVATRSIIKR